MDIPGPVELMIIAGVIIVLFGSKKLPDAARSMGRSLRIFKSEVKELRDEPTTPEAASTLAAPTPVAAPAQSVDGTTAAAPDKL